MITKEFEACPGLPGGSMPEIQLSTGSPCKRSAERRNRRIQGLLNKAIRDPRRVLRDRRIRKARFCLPFFELCDAVAYEHPERAAELAAAAVEIGERSGDRHLVNRSLGVEINARIALAQWQRAKEALERHEAIAASCCEGCLADHLHRRADLDLEYRRTPEALLCLEEAWPLVEKGWGGAELGRLLNQRGVGRHFRGENGAAIGDVGTALLIMPLDAPPLYFRDAISFMACFLAGGDQRLDELALRYLAAFRKRLKGRVGWQVVLTRLRWLEGLIYARLGEDARAAARLESARNGLRKELASPSSVDPALVTPAAGHEAPQYSDCCTREMVALTADLSQLSSQRRETRAITSMLYTAQTTLTLDSQLGQVLNETYQQVRTSPESALEYLVDLRSAVRIPVPDLLAERYLTRSRSRFKSSRSLSASPYSFPAVASLSA